MNMPPFPRVALLALATSCVPAFAFAQQMPPPPVPTAPPAPSAPALDASEKSFWDNESLLVKQLRLMDLRAQIAEARRKVDGEGSRRSGGGDAVNIHPPLAAPLIRPGSTLPGSESEFDFATPPPVRAPRPSGTFDVVGIWGIEGDHTADVLNNGMRVSVREGDALPEGWKVQSIRRTGIVITKGQQRETLVVAAALGD